jgi:DNA-binding transcriptional regulator YhcF (GntR family)
MKLTAKQLRKMIKEEVSAYAEGDTQPSAHRSSGQQEQLYRQIEASIKSAIHIGIGIEDILQRITTYIDTKGYMDPKFDQ